MTDMHKINDVNTILDSITDGFFTLDKDWRFMYVNKAVELFTSRKKEDYIGRNFWELFPVAKNLKYWAEYHRAVDQQVSVIFEEYSPSFDQWALIRAYPSSYGLTVYYHNITEEKKLLEKINADEQSLRILLNNINDPIWSLDKDYNIVLCNNAFIEWIFFFTNKRLNKGDNLLSEELGSTYLEKFEMCYKYAFYGKPINAVEDYNVNGEVKYATISVNPVFDDKGNVTGLTCFARDITQSRKHLMQIEEQNRMLMEIAAIQSHKIRGPVATILGLVQLFNFDDTLDPTNEEIIKGVAIAAEDLDTAIKDIVQKTNKIKI